MLHFTTEQLVAFDECPRKFSFIEDFEPIRITLSAALYKSLAAGLKSGLPEVAESTMMQLAAAPGLAIQGVDVYSIAQHHAKLMEIVSTYLLAQPGGKLERWRRPDPVNCAPGLSYRPQSYEEDGRLRRIVLASAWTKDRELEERNSWRTVGDIVCLNKPMLVNVIVIGALREGYRHSFWTNGLSHPQNRQLRFQGRRTVNGGRYKLSSAWLPLHRENYESSTLDWLRIMQQDECFDSLVHSFEIPVPDNAGEIQAQLTMLLEEMAVELEEGRRMPRRSACYRAFYPCQFANVCPKGLESPLEAGFQHRFQHKEK